MTLTQAHDFLAESEALRAILRDDLDYAQPTQFKGWTLNDVLVHLHFWNCAADLSATDEPAFNDLMGRLMASLQSGGLRPFENDYIAERGTPLRDMWIDKTRDMAPRWAAMDPKTRLPWAGPSMSARSSITARQMETWAHASEIFDILGQTRVEEDARIKNIVVLGVNTFGWSHTVHGLPAPETMPELILTAPSGAEWRFSEASAGQITGPAVDFACVVTQTRAFADTDLTATGDIAKTWMANAQCFAGPPETPPAPGSRHKV